MAGRTMSARLMQLEAARGYDARPRRVLIDHMPPADQLRVKGLLADRDAGVWSEPSQLRTDDLRALCQARLEPLHGDLLS